jgi:hypothetical protein
LAMEMYPETGEVYSSRSEFRNLLCEMAGAQ